MHVLIIYNFWQRFPLSPLIFTLGAVLITCSLCRGELTSQQVCLEGIATKQFGHFVKIVKSFAIFESSPPLSLNLYFNIIISINK